MSASYKWVASPRMWPIRFPHSLSLIWFDREEGPCWKSLKEHSGRFSLPAAVDNKDKNFRIRPLGSWGTAKHSCAKRPGWPVHQATRGRMAVNLSKNGPALMAAYKEVVDSKSDTNWWAGSFLVAGHRRRSSSTLYFNMSSLCLGRCSPTKGTVMISVWQEREVKSASFILRPLFSHS